MTESEILHTLRKAGFIDSMMRPHTPAWDAFLKEMERKQYGPHECWEAWLWFKHGWEAHREATSSPVDLP